jgi:hypothetical protein
LSPLKAAFKLAPGTIFFNWFIFFSKNIPYPWDLLFGFTIQVAFGFF